MAEHMRPASPQQAPDPANNYERAHPENEAGMGRMENNNSTPTQRPDQQQSAVGNRQEPRQINAHEVSSAHPDRNPNEQPQPDHSMKDEEPLDEYPTDINNPRHRRHPRTEGKGGTP